MRYTVVHNAMPPPWLASKTTPIHRTFRLEPSRPFDHKSSMNLSRTPTAHRALYALALSFSAILLALLALPRPGVRVAELRPAAAPDSPSIPFPAPNRIRVASYNLEHFTDARRDGPERSPEIFAAHVRGAAAIVSEADPDVLLLQEIENARALLALNAALPKPFDFAYVSDLRNSSGPRDKLNLALLSRLPPARVRQLGFHALEGAGRPTRGALSAAFDFADGSSLLVYNVHLKSNFGDAPRNQAQRAVALHLVAADSVSESFRNVPRPTSVLVLGDTNVDPDSDQFASDPSLEPLAGSFLDLWRGRPIDERTTIATRHPGDTNLVFPPAAFDRVFASKNLAGSGPWFVSPPQAVQKGSATRDNTLQPGVGGHVSDHYLVFVDLLRSPSPSPPAD